MFDYNIDKNENLSYKDKEHIGDYSFILTVRIFFLIKYLKELKANSDINCNNPNNRSHSSVQ